MQKHPWGSGSVPQAAHSRLAHSRTHTLLTPVTGSSDQAEGKEARMKSQQVGSAAQEQGLDPHGEGSRAGWDKEPVGWSEQLP